MISSLSPEVFRDKVLGCWMGKNAGGTLGTPLEKAFGQAEPFDVWWYPRLEPGGIPNDDLELQLIWLLALEEVGPTLTASDLAQYWLDYVGYNWDEYGFHRINLKLGLQPPVSSVYNNWFKDCMGCPIRSEIWACIAPGFPRLAVRYAYEDAIIDHAGGEGFYGELFNTAIQSAAFVLNDPKTLIEIGLSYVPEQSKTFAAVQAALKGYAAGDDWKQARLRVMEAAPHYNAQYAPLNMGFQVIGWLYGNDFGDAICKAVNCGYDTDCTGATLGSYIGIAQGNQALPAKWLEPLGTVIATNASWGGLRNLDKCTRAIPANTIELTDRTLAVARRVLAYHGLSLDSIPYDLASLKADAASRALLNRNPWRIEHRTCAVNVGVEYPKSAAIATGQTRRLVTHLQNPHASAVELQVELQGPASFAVENASRTVALAPKSELALDWNVSATGSLEPSNRLNLSLSVKQRPALPAVPIILTAATKWRFQKPISAEGRSDRELFDTAFDPEIVRGSLTTAAGRSGDWIEADSDTNPLPVPFSFEQAGAFYAQTFSWSPVTRPVRLGVACNVPVKIWLNGKPLVDCFVYRPLRPALDGPLDGQPIPYLNTEFKSGWNEILVKFVRGDAQLIPSSTSFAAEMVMADPTDLNAGLTDQVRSRFPWT